MKKLIDFDGLFDEKLAEYIRDNPTKYTEKQWENVIPKLYRQFGDTYVAKAGATPRQYYSSMTDEELCDALARHVSEGVPVSDFLCREIERRGCTDALVRLLSLREEEILTLAVNLAGSSEKAYPAYFDLLISEVSADIKEAVCEQLKGGADAAKERAIACYEAGQEREIMLEILSRCKQRDDRVFDILMNAFRTGDEVPMHASYLALTAMSARCPFCSTISTATTSIFWSSANSNMRSRRWAASTPSRAILPTIRTIRRSSNSLSFRPNPLRARRMPDGEDRHIESQRGARKCVAGWKEGDI